MFKKLRYLLFPFSIIYGGVIKVRNLLFDKKILRSAVFDVPLICVGNLAVGGTGKTPMVEYLVRMIEKKYKVATLSRGYKRRTKGFLIADAAVNAELIGDEPMQIHTKFPDVTVAVAEERVMGIPQLLHANPETKVIILDDAFQHREVNAGLNILLTDCQNLYSSDLLLPAGNLRDNRSSSRRAQLIVVTKCDPELSEQGRQRIIEQLQPLPHQKIYFTAIEYETPSHLFTKEKFSLHGEHAVLLITGIANPKPVEARIEQTGAAFQLLRFNDHHPYSLKDIQLMKSHFSKLPNEKKMILTTEKDAVRLLKFEKELESLPVYVLPMAHRILFNEAAEFERDIFRFVNSYEEVAAKET